MENERIQVGGLPLELPDVAQAMRQLAGGLVLSTVFGAAMGARFGLTESVSCALAAPSALLGLACFAAPALYIAMAHSGAEVPALLVARATSSCVETTGRVLGGLAPAMWLLSATLETDVMTRAAYAAGFAMAMWLGLRTLRQGLTRALVDAPRLPSLLVVYTFSGFCWLLAGRLWWAASPLLSGVGR